MKIRKNVFYLVLSVNFILILFLSCLSEGAIQYEDERDQTFIFGSGGRSGSSNTQAPDISAKPVLYKDINDVGIEEAKRYQYYISKAVKLELAEPPNDTSSSINSQGHLVKEIHNTSQVVNIAKYTAGGLISYIPQTQSRPLPEGLILNVTFADNKSPELPTIPFARVRNGPDDKYYIRYSDADKHTIQYGNHTYTVNYEGQDEAPHLLVIVEESVIGTTASKTEGGYTVVR
jgi:hypothetical protein